MKAEMLYGKMLNYNFAVTKVGYLGHLISSNGISVDRQNFQASKVQAIQCFPDQITKEMCSRFLDW